MRLDVSAAVILDFDIENRPQSYYGSDLTTCEITAIAAGWADQDRVECALLGEHDLPEILDAFVELYDQADVVTGHYIRRHDLPIVNGALVEHGMRPLSPKLTIDTKLDLVSWSFQAQPKSQQELALALGIDSPKVQMSQFDWREANRLTPTGLELTRQRVVGDVKQHKELRLELHRRGLLGPPKLWQP